MRHPVAHARGLGPARSGSGHWWQQRLTSIILALLVPWVLLQMIAWSGMEYIDIRADIANPLNAALLLAFLLSMFWHARLGLQVVIEDYVHTVWLEFTLQISVILIFGLAALASILAIGRIVFSA